MKRKAFFIGLGLIGGSIALAVKKAHEDVTIQGYDVNEDQVKMALALQIIDQSASSIKEGAKDADLIVISAPVKQTEKIIDELVDINLKETVIVTDVGSTKHQIVQKASLLHEKGVTFIGGHPMAGSHKSGVSAAKSHLFENAFYVLTPFEETPKESIEELKNWLAGTNATFLEMTADQHDQIAGAISHFPHIIAASLVHQVSDLEKENTIVSRLAAGGFRDITRIASGSPVMWRDILLHNKETLLELLEKWENEMNEVREMIENVDSESIYNYFQEAKKFRDGLPSRKSGAIPAFYDLYVDVPDYPGIISEVTGILAEKEISITNIRIIEAREDILGVLRLSFQNEQDRKRGKECLEEHGYDTYISN